jgi:hypothetical protein
MHGISHQKPVPRAKQKTNAADTVTINWQIAAGRSYIGIVMEAAPPYTGENKIM